LLRSPPTETSSAQLQGYNAQKASFSRTINVKQVGHALLTLTPSNTPSQPETYLITLPALHIESLITGSPYVELDKYTHIASSTGYVSKIDYSGKGWLSGKKNTFTAAMWKEGEGDDKSPLYTVEGQWNDTFAFSMHEGGKSKKGKQVESYRTAPTTPLKVAPIDQQDPFESRCAWRHVAASIAKGDMDAVSHHKSKIENAQRELRKKEKDEARDWERKFFRTIGEDADPVFAKLVKMVGGATPWAGVESEKTGGVWRFDPERAGRATKPFHPEVGERAGLGENGGSGGGSGSEPVSKVSTNTSDGGKGK
jgi:oxysterol-binding protein-related protein 9/10/11